MASGSQIFPVPPSIGTLSVPPGLATKSTLASLEAKVATEPTLLLALAELIALNAKVPASGLATEATLALLEGKDFATETTLASIDLKMGAGLATEVTLAAINTKVATEVTSAAILAALPSLATEATLLSLAGSDFATETTLAAMNAKIPASGLATEATLALVATEVTLAAILADTASIDAKVATKTTLASILADTALLVAKDFATETTLLTRATETTLLSRASEATLLASNVLLTSLDAKDFATQTTLAAVDATLSALNAKFPDHQSDLHDGAGTAITSKIEGGGVQSLDVNIRSGGSDATEATLLAILATLPTTVASEATLTTIAGLDFATQTTLAAIDFATETTLSTVSATLTAIDTKLGDDKVDLHDGGGTAVTSTNFSGKQSLDVNVAGFTIDEINVNLQDGAGTDITSTTVGPDQALDVNIAQSVDLGALLKDALGTGLTSTTVGPDQALDVNVVASPGSTQSDTHDGVGTAITSTVVASDTGLDVNIIAMPGGGTQSDTYDGAGTPITSTVTGGDTALDVNISNQADVLLHDHAGNGIDSTAEGGGIFSLKVSIASDAVGLATSANQVLHNTKLDTIITNTTGLATEATLATLAGTDFATETTLSALNLKDFATETTLLLTNTALATLNATDFATETTLSALNLKDFATETTLSALNATDFATETTLLASNVLLTAIDTKLADDQVDLHDGLGVAITSTVIGPDTGIDVNVLGTITITGDVNVNDGVGNDITSTVVGPDTGLDVNVIGGAGDATAANQVLHNTKLDTLITQTADNATKTTLALLNAKDFATQTTLNSVDSRLSTLNSKDFATETTLASALTSLQLIDNTIITDGALNPSPFQGSLIAGTDGTNVFILRTNSSGELITDGGGGGGTQSDTHDGVGTPITSTVVGPDTGLDTNVIASALPAGAATEVTLASIETDIALLEGDRQSDTHDGAGTAITSTLEAGGEQALDVHITGGGFDAPPIVPILNAVFTSIRHTSSSTGRVLALEFTIPDTKKFYLTGFVLTKFEINSISLDPGEIGWTTDGGTNFFDFELESQKGAGSQVEWGKDLSTPVFIAAGVGTDVRIQVFITASGSTGTDWFVRFTGVLGD